MNKKNINDLIKVFLPVSSNVIGAPRKEMKISDKEENTDSTITIKQLETYDFHEQKNAYPAFFKSHIFHDTHKFFVASLQNARVWGRNGAVVSAGDHFIRDVSREFNKGSDFDHSIFYTIKQKKAKYLEGKTAVIGTAGANVYYHWMFDILPRIGLISALTGINTIDHWITEYIELPFQIETLKILGVPIEKITRSNKNWEFHIRAENLIVPSLAGPLDQPTAFQISFLRQAFGHLMNKLAPFRRLYITRRKTGRRMIVNEDEIIDFLSVHNFQIIYCEELSFQEQVAIFSEAEIIVAPHGSSLTNLVFCNPGTKVLDIFNESQINPCFWFVSHFCNLSYNFFVGKSVPINNNYKDDNITVDAQQLKNAIQQLLSNQD